MGEVASLRLPVLSSAVRGSGSRPEAEGNAAEEARLVARAVSGDLEAFSTLLDAHRQRAFSLAARVLADAEEAEDVVQEAFIAAHRGLRRFRGEAQFGTWLYRIVLRRALDRRRKLRRHAAPPAPSERTQRQREQAAAVHAAIEDLPEKLRVCVLMYYFEGHTAEEMAALLEIPRGTVWSRLYHARKRLARALRDAEG